jgi:hypothetical protein
MACFFELTTNVPMIWGRYDEGYENYYILLNFSSDIQDPKLQSEVLLNMCNIHAILGVFDYLIKIIGGVFTFGFIAIALRRRFERRFRH